MQSLIARVRLFVVALGGVVGGHAIALAIPAARSHVHPDGSVHAHDAMHAYLPRATTILLPLAAIALISLTVGLMRERDGFSALPALVRLQTGLFVAVEVVEHIGGGVPVESLLDAPALWIGIAAQLGVSGTLAAFALLATHAVNVRHAPLRTSPRPIVYSALRRPQSPDVDIQPHLSHATVRRGPPRLAPV